MSMTNQSSQAAGVIAPQTFTYFADPAHAWLRVPLALIHQLGIAAQVTGFSYRDDNHAYLEEDLDAVTFIKAYLKSIGKAETDYAHFKSLLNLEKWTNCYSLVRNLSQF